MPWTAETLQDPFISETDAVFPEPNVAGVWLGANPVLPRQHRVVLPATVRHLLPETGSVYWGDHRLAEDGAVIAPYKETLEALRWCTSNGRCRVAHNRVLAVPEERFSLGETLHFVSTFRRLNNHHLIFLVRDRVLRRSLQEYVRKLLGPPTVSIVNVYHLIINLEIDTAVREALTGDGADPVTEAITDVQLDYLLRIICQGPLNHLEDTTYDPDLLFIERAAFLADPEGAYPEALTSEGDVLNLSKMECIPVTDLPEKPGTHGHTSAVSRRRS